MNRNTQSETNGEVHQVVVDAAGKALEAVQEHAGHAAMSAEKWVRQHPWAAIGLALGGGFAVGAIGQRLMAPRPRSWMERIGLAAAAAATAKNLGKLL